MQSLSQQQLARVCRLFMEHAYADALDTIPPKKKAYFEMPEDGALTEFLPPSPAAAGIVEDMAKRKEGPVGYELRLGCAHFPHLKLRLQHMDYHGKKVWVHMVDTHDAFFSKLAQDPTHPEAGECRRIAELNGKLKRTIETALDQAGFLTPNALLRLGLTSSAS
jgi:hypothetical protein